MTSLPARDVLLSQAEMSRYLIRVSLIKHKTLPILANQRRESHRCRPMRAQYIDRKCIKTGCKLWVTYPALRLNCHQREKQSIIWVLRESHYISIKIFLENFEFVGNLFYLDFTGQSLGVIEDIPNCWIRTLFFVFNWKILIKKLWTIDCWLYDRDMREREREREIERERDLFDLTLRWGPASQSYRECLQTQR